MKKIIITILLSSLSAIAGNDQGGGTYSVCGAPLVSFLKKAEKFEGYREFFEITQKLGQTYPIFQNKLLKIRDVFWYEIPCDIKSNKGSALPFQVDKPITFWNDLVFVFKKKFDTLPNKSLAILNESLRRICHSSQENYKYRDANSPEDRAREGDRCTLQYTSAVIAFSRGDISEKQLEEAIDLPWVYAETRQEMQALIDYWLKASEVAVEVTNKFIQYCSGEINQVDFTKYYTSQIPHLAPEYNIPYMDANPDGFAYIFEAKNLIQNKLPVCENIRERVQTFQKNLSEFNHKLDTDLVARHASKYGAHFPYVITAEFNFNF